MYSSPPNDNVELLLLNNQGAYKSGASQKKKGWDRLKDRQGIFIKQKLDVAEAIFGCEQANTYYVYPLGNDEEKKGKKFYKCKEKSDCLAKQCLTGGCRPFVLHVNIEDDDEEIDNTPFLMLDRPCKCTFFCFDRPEMSIRYVEDGRNDYLGKVRDVFICCGVRFEILDALNNLKYVINGSVCQWGMWCPAPCDQCENITFDIQSPSGEVISTIKKKSPGCLNAMVSDADNYAINFPNGATKEEKALLMSAALLLDYLYFEEKGGVRDMN